MPEQIGAVLFIFSLLVGSAWAQSPKSSQTAPPQRQSPDISALQKQVEDLKTQVAGLKEKLTNAESTQTSLFDRVLKLELNQKQNVALDLTSRSYQRIDSDSGSFLISIEDAMSYLDGYRVTLDIGNTSVATFNGFKIHSKWNKTFDWSKYTTESYEKWQKAIRERDDSFPDSLLAGRWNKVDLLLPSTTGDQLGYFEVSLQTTTVSLGK